MTPRERNLAEIDVIALKHGLTREQILGRFGKRSESIASARCDVAHHFRSKDYEWNKIGRLVNRDHSTVIHWSNYRCNPGLAGVTEGLI